MESCKATPEFECMCAGENEIINACPSVNDVQEVCRITLVHLREATHRVGYKDDRPNNAVSKNTIMAEIK